MITGNKGEWSEIYTLLKIIGDKNLFSGDSNLKKIEQLIFPIIKILREESNNNFEFSYNNDIVLKCNNEEEFRIPIISFKEQATFLLSKLKEKTNTTFSIPEVELFMNSFSSNSIKAKSTSKSDIKIVIHDQRTGTTPILGFSIKSQLGGASTLLNAGRTTNFIYKISDLDIDEDIINNIETKSKIKDRISKIYELGGKFKFIKTESSIFENNLMLIDSGLPIILGQTLLKYNTTNKSKTSELISEITDENPMKFNLENEHPFYPYKIKRFLTDIALGMMPSKVWTGELDATGGYLIVKEDGEVLCYHIYNRNEFEDYLFYNTRFETASSTRHGFGILFKESNQLFFKLNLQIRFL